MESVDDLPSAVATLHRELTGNDFDAQQAAVATVARILENVVREQLDDELLAASLDGLSTRSIKVNADGSVEITGAFYTVIAWWQDDQLHVAYADSPVIGPARHLDGLGRRCRQSIRDPQERA